MPKRTAEGNQVTVTLTRTDWRAVLGSLAVTDDLTVEVSEIGNGVFNGCRTAKDMDAVEGEGDCHVFELMLRLTKYDTPGRAVIRRSVMAYRAIEAWENNRAMKEAA